MNTHALVALLSKSDLLVLHHPDGNVQRYVSDPSLGSYNAWWPVDADNSVSTNVVRQLIVKALIAAGQPFNSRDISLALDLLRAKALDATESVQVTH